MPTEATDSRRGTFSDTDAALDLAGLVLDARLAECPPEPTPAAPAATAIDDEPEPPPPPTRPGFRRCVLGLCDGTGYRVVAIPSPEPDADGRLAVEQWEVCRCSPRYVAPAPIDVPVSDGVPVMVANPPGFDARPLTLRDLWDAAHAVVAPYSAAVARHDLHTAAQAQAAYDARWSAFGRAIWRLPAGTAFVVDGHAYVRDVNPGAKGAWPVVAYRLAEAEGTEVGE